MATKRVITLVAGVSAWACNGDGTQPAGPPFDLLKSGGDTQNWYFNNPLPTPLSVTAVDVSGQPVPGVVVTWGVTSGGVSPVQSTTNANGVATTTDSLGSSTVQTVSASFTGLPNAATFTEVASTPPTSGAVDVKDNFFSPQTVDIQEGGTVTWTFAGAIAHTVTFTGGPDSGTPQTSGTFGPVTFASAGTRNYFCKVHGSMTGTIRVVH